MKQYEVYKDSGVEWLDKIPSHWKTLPFKRLFSFGRGLAITKADLVDNGLSVISYGQIHSKKNTGTSIEEHLLRYVPESLEKGNENSLVKKGDFVFADTSEDIEGCGNCVYADKEMILYAGYHTIIAKANQSDNSKFLAYLFKTDCWRSQIRSAVNGVKVFSITQNVLSETTVLIPSIQEQQNITAFLDEKVSKIDAIIAEKEAMVEDLQKYRKTIISETVTQGLNPDVTKKDSGIDWIGLIPENWKVCKIKYTGTFDNGLTYSPEDIVEDGVLVLRSSNIQNGSVAFDDNVYVKEVPEELMVNDGDIIICSRNGSANLVGKCAYIDHLENASFGAFMMRYRPTIHGKYAFYAFQAATSFYKGLYSTSTINQITKAVIDQMFIAVPSNEEQALIADHLDKALNTIDVSTQDLLSQIEDLKSYKASLITEAVTGKIDLR